MDFYFLREDAFGYLTTGVRHTPLCSVRCFLLRRSLPGEGQRDARVLEECVPLSTFRQEKTFCEVFRQTESAGLEPLWPVALF